MLKRIPLNQFPIDKKALLRQKPTATDQDKIYRETAIYTLNDRPAIIYGKLEPRDDDALWACKTMELKAEERTMPGGQLGAKGVERKRQGQKEGLGESRIFGFRPPIPFGANYCGPTSSALDFPKQNDALAALGRRICGLYKEICPEEFSRQESLSNEVRSEWRIPGTIFTSGIVNRNNALKYHFDKGNFTDVMSCMVVFKSRVEGGDLSVPGFGARWDLADHTFFFFDGQKHLHGVTRIFRNALEGYRYSVVFYSLKAMLKCGSVEEELARARSQKRAVNLRRA